MTNPIKQPAVWADRLRIVTQAGLWVAMIAFIFSRALLLIGIYGALIAWLLVRVMEKKPIFPSTPVNFSLVLVALTLILSIAWNGDWSEGLKGFHKWLRGFLVLGMSYDLLQNEKIKRNISLALTIALVIATFDGLFQYATGKDFLRGYQVGFVNAETVRLTSSFGYFGMFASFLLMATPIAAAYVLQMAKDKKYRSLFLASILCLSLLNLYLTRARGAWVSAILVFFLLFATLRRWKMILGFLVVLAAFSMLIPKDLIFHHQKTVGVDKTVHQRMIFWQQAAHIIQAQPVFGCGLNTYVKNIKKYNLQGQTDVSDYYAHNGYLQHAAETGLVGLTAFLFFILKLLFECFKCGNLEIRKTSFWERLMPAFSVCGFLFYMFFDTIFHNLQPFLLFWLLAGWALAGQSRIRTASK